MERVNLERPITIRYTFRSDSGVNVYSCTKCMAVFANHYCPYCMRDRSIKQALIYARLEPGGA